MTPRPEVDFLLINQPLGEILRTVQRSAFTRLPLCKSDLDHVIGQIHMKDLFNHLKLVPGKLKFLDETTPMAKRSPFPPVCRDRPSMSSGPVRSILGRSSATWCSSRS